MIIAVPQPEGGVRIKVRSGDAEGLRERQGLWKLWIENLLKRHHCVPSPEPEVAQGRVYDIESEKVLAYERTDSLR